MLAKLMAIDDKDVISLVGAGGKTRAMFFLSKRLQRKKILISTTTKIYLPPKEHYNFYGIGSLAIDLLNQNREKGIYLAAEKIDSQENKLIGFDANTLAAISSNYDVSFIESDGAKKKLLKGWHENEPVIIKNTTKTMGIINFKLLGMPVNAANIHRVSAYTGLTGAKLNQIISLEQLKTLVLHQRGLFKNSQGERILYINMIETLEDEENANKFLELFKNKELSYFGKIIIGSFNLAKFKRII